jgi:hypothetical protein
MNVAAKIRQQACTTGKSRFDTASTSACPMPGIDEHHLDQDHAGDQIGEVQRDHVDDRRPGIRQRVLHDHLPGGVPLSRAISI